MALDRLPPPRLMNVGGLVVAAATGYEGVARDFVIGHKERRRYALTAPLGHALARAIHLAVATNTASDPLPSQQQERQAAHQIVLVPIPSANRRTRGRGHDPLARLVSAARGALAPEMSVNVAALLAHRRRVADQSDLDRGARQLNLVGAFGVSARRRDRLMTQVLTNSEPSLFVIVDDILTTGSTLGEADRALRSVGLGPSVGAVICAVNRRA